MNKVELESRLEFMMEEINFLRQLYEEVGLTFKKKKSGSGILKPFCLMGTRPTWDMLVPEGKNKMATIQLKSQPDGHLNCISALVVGAVSSTTLWEEEASLEG